MLVHLDRRLRAVCGVNPHAAHSKLLCIEYRLTNVRCMRSIRCWLTDDARWWLLYRHHRQNHHWRYYAHAIIDDRCGWQKGRAICERRMRFGHRFHTATHSVWPVSHCRWWPLTHFISDCNITQRSGGLWSVFFSIRSLYGLSTALLRQHIDVIRDIHVYIFRV